jgi:low molecular weight protein-tyrosine phosphatase
MQRILFVCTGNICRSPTAEGLFRARAAALGLAGRLEADSAGTTGYHVGDPPSAPAIRIAAAHDIDLRPLRARRLESADFERFDLALGMDRGHLAAMEALAPAGARAKLALLLDYAPALGRREVPDPYYGDDEDYRRSFALIAAGIDGLLAALAQAGPSA